MPETGLGKDFDADNLTYGSSERKDRTGVCGAAATYDGVICTLQFGHAGEHRYQETVDWPENWRLVTYAIDKKTPHGEWIKHIPVHGEYADESLAELRAKHPDKEFRLRRMTTVAEVIERV